MRILGTLVAGLTLLLPALAAAQDFPTKPIKLIVPFPAGGPNDIIARVVGQRMSELMKQPVVIDNRGGQGGVIGTDAVAKAAPDGYTIAISSAGALAISPSMQSHRLRHAEGSGAGNAGRDRAGNAGGRHQRSGRQSEGAGRACEGAARQTQFCFLRARQPAASGRRTAETDRRDRHRPCALSRGGAGRERLLAQQVEMVFLDLPVLLPQIKAGTLRPIAIGSPERAPTAMEVPT